MKQHFFLAFITLVLFAACKKDTATCTYVDSNIVAPQIEKDSVARYISANNIMGAVADASGIYYKINNPGTGTVNPGVCNFITVKYQGTTFSGSFFDGTTGNTTRGFDLGGVIVGWQKGLPKLRSGGSITLYIPPTLAYGPGEIKDANNNVVIPANSYLKFDIDLVAVQ